MDLPGEGRGRACPIVGTGNLSTFSPVLDSTPPFALAVPVFRFRALAALAARAQLGGPREVAIACYLAARLALAMAGPAPLSPDARAGRAAAARAWLSSLALPAGVRLPLARLIDQTGGTDPAAVAHALARVTDITAKYLDPGALLELQQLGRQIAG